MDVANTPRIEAPKWRRESRSMGTPMRVVGPRVRHWGNSVWRAVVFFRMCDASSQDHVCAGKGVEGCARDEEKGREGKRRTEVYPPIEEIIIIEITIIILKVIIWLIHTIARIIHLRCWSSCSRLILYHARNMAVSTMKARRNTPAWVAMSPPKVRRAMRRAPIMLVAVRVMTA